MSITMDERWATIAATLESATSIAWDGCHKIYVLMDEEQHREMQSYDYDPLVEVGDDTEAALATLREWYDESCPLRFVNAVRTVDGDPNDGFDALIPQFADEDDEWVTA